MKHLMPAWFTLLCSLGFGCATVDDDDLSAAAQMGVGLPGDTPTPQIDVRQMVDNIVGPATASDGTRRYVGLSIAVIVDGSKYIFNYGEAVKGKGVAPTSSTLYAIGSLTKTFTGTMLPKLHWAGTLDWHDLLTDHISQNLTGGRQDITLRHLAVHQAGLTKSHPGSNATYQTGTYAGDMAAVRNSLLTCNSTYPCVAPHDDDEPHGYSNWGYQVLADTLSSAAGTSTPTMLRNHLFTPLGMASTGYKWELRETTCLAPSTTCNYSDYGNCTYVSACNYSFNRRVAPGYYNNGGTVTLGGDGQGSDDAAAVGSGTLWSTASDMQKWLAFQMNANGTNTATQEQYLASAHAERTDDHMTFFAQYGDTAEGHRVMIKSGDITDQFHSGLAFTDDRKVGVVVLANYAGVNAKDMARQIIDGLVP